ncbi:MAG: hypothetical protein ACRD21_05490 [Vicinamibacteria bacterium]
MNIALQLTKAEEARALPILLRHSSGVILPVRIYVISREAMRDLQQAGVSFTVLSTDSNMPKLEKVAAGERV